MRDVKEMLMLDKLRDPSIISKGRRNFDMEITGRHGGCLDMTLPEALDKIFILHANTSQPSFNSFISAVPYPIVFECQVAIF